MNIVFMVSLGAIMMFFIRGLGVFLMVCRVVLVVKIEKNKKEQEGLIIFSFFLCIFLLSVCALAYVSDGFIGEILRQHSTWGVWFGSKKMNYRIKL